MKLLIVDDEPIIRKGIKKFIDFDALGIDEVFEAADGVEAMVLVEGHRPDVVLADINMPKMDGLAFSEKVKGIVPNAKIALITGYDYFDYAQKAIKIGVDDYVLKPVSKEDIRQLLVKLVAMVKKSAADNEVKSIVDAYQEAYSSVDDDHYKMAMLKIMDEGCYDSEFSLTLMAEELGLSLGYTSGLFKQNFQMSFKEYLLKRRLDRSRILLLSTDMKLYEVADSVGFNDPNYFSSAFRKQYGTSPGKYREKARDGL